MPSPTLADSLSCLSSSSSDPSPDYFTHSIGGCSFQVQLYNRRNWFLWSAKIERILKLKGLWHVTEQDKLARAMAIVHFSLQPAHQQKINNCKTPANAILELKPKPVKK